MERKMFCFQCEQAAVGNACTGAKGVCKKAAKVANLQDQLTGALIGLARSLNGNEHLATAEIDRLIMEGLYATSSNVSFQYTAVLGLLEKINAAKQKLAPECSQCTNSCGKNDDYDLALLWVEKEDIRALKSMILFGIRGLAAFAYHADRLGYCDKEINAFLYRALFALGMELETEELYPLVMEVGKVNYKCMELLDQAHTKAFGIPIPTEVSLEIEPGPFIVVSGQDLYELKCILEETEGMGINIYTHGEMLLAHAYPELKKFSHLKGNFGTAWQNQQKEFEEIPGIVIFTTNCLMQLKSSYADCVYTRGLVSYTASKYLGEDQDYTKPMKKAKMLGGYEKEQLMTGINGGSKVVTGYGHGAVLPLVKQLAKSVKRGKIKHLYLIGGCDGENPDRSYYTDFVKAVPEDCIVLTFGCGKYRFNDLEMGTVNGIPRLMDMGQCNDAYSAIKVLQELAKELKCSVNELPLTVILSWYEQKSFSVLLTLLSLGIQNIKLGPSLPAFISPNVWSYLEENYQIAPITNVLNDLVLLAWEKNNKENAVELQEN